MLGAVDSGRYAYIGVVIWLQQHANMALWLYWLQDKQKVQNTNCCWLVQCAELGGH